LFLVLHVDMNDFCVMSSMTNTRGHRPKCELNLGL